METAAQRERERFAARQTQITHESRRPFRLRDVAIRWTLNIGLLAVVWWQAPWSVALCLTLLVMRCEIIDTFVCPPPRR